MTSDCSSCVRCTGFHFVESLHCSGLPAQMPLVSGCDGFTDRAHSNTWGKRPATISRLFLGSFWEESLVLSGSFHTSQASTRESFANAPTTPVTYVLSRGY